MTTAKERIVDALDRFQRNHDRLMAIGTSVAEQNQSIVNTIHFFTFATLLETLRQQDEKAADRLGDWFDVMFEDGGAAEVVHEWRSELAEGGGIELPTLDEP
jgi:hypothetical protein